MIINLLCNFFLISIIDNYTFIIVKNDLRIIIINY